MRLVILCEGDTEKRVLKEFLAPYCSTFSRIDVLNSRGSGNLKQAFYPLAELELDDDPDAVVFCLIDLLEVPYSFPTETNNSPDPNHAKFMFIQGIMRHRVKESVRERFFVFPVVMELETWLLADDQALMTYFHPPASAHNIRYYEPESISRPSDELSNLVRRFRTKEDGYKKTTHGPNIFRVASAQRVYADNCPHFKLLIDQLQRVQGLKTDESPPVLIPHHELYQKLEDIEEQYNSLWEKIEEQGDLTDQDCVQIDFLEREKERIAAEIVREYSE